jgi:hypothetical protein
MDTHYLKIYEYYKSEFDLYEGLITSYSLYRVIDILKRKNYDVKPNFKNNTFTLFHIFSDDASSAIKEHNDIMKITNTCGYFCSSILDIDNVRNYQKYDKNKVNYLIKKDINSILFSFEAKYDILIENIPDTLYHLTPTKYVSKILKFGLVPKNRSKKSYHPERIYLTYKIEDITKICMEFYKISGNKEWTILKINTDIISDYLKLYKDPNFLEKGVYTLNTIHPMSISIYDSISL